jgi:hypothetical protein
LKLLNEHEVEYLLVGGYAVVGFDLPELSPALFLEKDRIIRLGIPPIRIEITTTLSGVSFEQCYAERSVGVLEGIRVNLISLEQLKINKKAAGRYKDLNDLENLP